MRILQSWQSVFIVLLMLVSGFALPMEAQTTERHRPAEWDQLVFGGRFMDRFMPMPDLGGMTENTWGAPNVIPRDIKNGIEDPNWSYWGGNTKLGADGNYHMMVCRWQEDAPKGHMSWRESTVVHAISDTPFGPYTVKSEIGPGHNPEWYVTKKGEYVLYVIDGAYKADDINGNWTKTKLEYNSRDRINTGGHHYLHNNTFARREDGSFLMINRHGQAWFSQDGIYEWSRVSDRRVYPPFEGKYEDPVVWKTNVQYHLIVNDWLGRIAWHLRSKDGVSWKVDQGEAYMPGIVKYKNGVKEDWFKYERIKVLQDEYGRATAANFAVIDTLKHYDLANDNHSSKLITIPLTTGRLMKVLNKKAISSKTKKIKIKIEAEEDFNPHTDIEFETLRLGASEEVNFGRGAVLKKVKKDGNDIVLIFHGRGNGISDQNFAAKLLGKDKQGELLFAYAKLPKVNYKEAILSARPPVSKNSEGVYHLEVEVQNFGQESSEKASLDIIEHFDGQSMKIAKGIVPKLAPFEKATITMISKSDISEKGNHLFDIIINKGHKDEVRLKGENFIPPKKKAKR